uniref:Uncharacterized protein n=1 Tax=Anguilla anguilla TaxID=7936 RepID=A0A0E9WSX8_ANGAN
MYILTHKFPVPNNQVRICRNTSRLGFLKVFLSPLLHLFEFSKTCWFTRLICKTEKKFDYPNKSHIYNESITRQRFMKLFTMLTLNW